MLYNGLLNTLIVPLLYSKPHSNSSNALDMLELHATLLMPNLAIGIHAYMHVRCIKFDIVLAPKIQFLIRACIL